MHMRFLYLSANNTWPPGAQAASPTPWAPWVQACVGQGLGPGPCVLGPKALKGSGSVLDPPCGHVWSDRNV